MTADLRTILADVINAGLRNGFTADHLEQHVYSDSKVFGEWVADALLPILEAREELAGMRELVAAADEIDRLEKIGRSANSEVSKQDGAAYWDWRENLTPADWLRARAGVPVKAARR